MRRLTELFSFQGRLRRRGWWLYFVLLFVVQVVGQRVVEIALGRPGMHGDYGTVGLIGLGAQLVTLWPSLAIGVRRLHDMGRSGWWLTPFNVAVVGSQLILAQTGWFTPGHGPVALGALDYPAKALPIFNLVYLATVLVIFGVMPGQKRGNCFGPQPGVVEPEREVFD